MRGKLAIVDHVGAKAGMDYFTGNLACALAENGGEVTVYSNFSGDCKVNYVQSFTGNRQNLLAKAVDFYMGHLSAFRKIFFSTTRQVVFHSFATGFKEFSVLLLAKLIGFKINIILHDVEGFAGDSRIYKSIIFRKFVSRIFVLNKFSKKVFLDTMGNDLESKISEIIHGHFISQTNPEITRELAREKLNWQEDQFYALFFGQIKKAKGLDLLIDAFKNIKNARLVIAGKIWKDDFKVYQDKIDCNIWDNIELNIRFISDEERELFFKAADVIVLPYRKIYQSGVLLMALSYGLPILASDLPANSEIIRDNETGFLFKTDSSEDLARQLNKIIENIQHGRNVGKAGLEMARRNYDWNEPALAILNSLFLPR